MTLGGPPVWDEPGGLSRCSTARRLAKDGRRQDDDYENEPEARQHAHDTGCRNPKHPQQYDADRQRRVGRAPPEMVRFG